MARVEDLLTKIVHAVNVGEEYTEITFTDGTILHITKEWDDYNDCEKLVTYYKDERLEGIAVDA